LNEITQTHLPLFVSKIPNFISGVQGGYETAVWSQIPPHKKLFDLINSNRESYAQFLSKTLVFAPKFFGIQDSSIETNPIQPAWNNGFFPGLDIVTLYSMLSIVQPKTYVEVGSGNSTKVAYKAKSDHQLATKIISIDPHPRAEIDALSDTVIREPFENVDYEIIFNLQENDILFIDNSHRILPNSDAMVFFLEILPNLQKGVIVHIHDIYLPYDYPQNMCDRFYSEQYGLAMYILSNPEKYHTLLPNYFISEDPELSKIVEPIWKHPITQNVERHGGSYWITIK
jgi:hypothetical protein